MSEKSESAKLVLELYDLRREKKMRKARNWVFDYNPTSVDDYMQTMMDEKNGAYLRMVTSYWEMAAALVNQGCIDRDVFTATNGEYFVVFAKVEPLLAELREKFDSPDAFSAMEQLINSQPGGPERLRKTQAWLTRVAAMRDSAKSENEEKAAKA
jgi:hypothetical protein